MTRAARATDASTALSTLVVLTIGLRLMLAGATVAVTVASDSLDRTGVRRLSESVAQAIREIHERSAAPAVAREPRDEPTWDATAQAPALAGTDAPAFRAFDRLTPWSTALPPPAIA